MTYVSEKGGRPKGDHGDYAVYDALEGVRERKHTAVGQPDRFDDVHVETISAGVRGSWRGRGSRRTVGEQKGEMEASWNDESGEECDGIARDGMKSRFWCLRSFWRWKERPGTIHLPTLSHQATPHLNKSHLTTLHIPTLVVTCDSVVPRISHYKT